jgi:isopentenyl phosphate kinase
VVKIGGSACTFKSQFETLNTAALHAVADQLAALQTERVSMALVHGAGSFGHKQAREYGVSKGTGSGADTSLAVTEETQGIGRRLCEGFAKTRLSVTTLNKYVTTALIERGIPAVTASPCPFVGTVAKKLPDAELPACAVEGIQRLREAGLVPVVHGDAVIDDAQGCAILSGDVWMVELSRELRAKRAVFVTDVDGVFTKPPTEAGAQLIKEIRVNRTTGELALQGVQMSCDTTHDVTGGLKEKLKCASDVLLGAPTIQAVYIVRAGSDSAAKALRGETPDFGTTLLRA